MLRELKDLKKEYRDLFTHLKTFKEDHHEAQSQIDIYKEKLLVQFEHWYSEEFETGATHQEALRIDQGAENGHLGSGAELGSGGGDFNADDEQNVFRRAKRNVDVLHKARKMEKSIR